ncbi:MAG: hypothetical protein U0R64_09450 [Candidatus Nanopelagicales bacterium]
MRRTAAALTATVLLTAVPAVAHAKGGTTGGTTTTQPLTANPCATLTLPKPSDALNIAGKTSAVMKLSVQLASCSTRASDGIGHGRSSPLG